MNDSTDDSNVVTILQREYRGRLAERDELREDIDRRRKRVEMLNQEYVNLEEIKKNQLQLLEAKRQALAIQNQSNELQIAQNAAVDAELALMEVELAKKRKDYAERLARFEQMQKTLPQIKEQVEEKLEKKNENLRQIRKIFSQPDVVGQPSSSIAANESPITSHDMEVQSPSVVEPEEDREKSENLEEAIAHVEVSILDPRLENSEMVRRFLEAKQHDQTFP